MALKGEAKTKYMREYMRRKRRAAPAAAAPRPAPAADPEMARLLGEYRKADADMDAVLANMLENETEKRKILQELLFRVIEHYDPDLADELPDDPSEMVVRIIEAMMEAEAGAGVDEG